MLIQFLRAQTDSISKKFTHLVSSYVVLKSFISANILFLDFTSKTDMHLTKDRVLKTLPGIEG